MVNAFRRNNLVHDEAAKVADELQEFIILVYVPSLVFLFFPSLYDVVFKTIISYKMKWNMNETHTLNQKVLFYGFIDI